MTLFLVGFSQLLTKVKIWKNDLLNSWEKDAGEDELLTTSVLLLETTYDVKNTSNLCIYTLYTYKKKKKTNVKSIFS